MVLAELEAFLSRPVAPTRRVALGSLDLSADPAPGFGGILLGGVAAHFAPRLDPDHREELLHLMDEVERGQRIAQPRVRHRLQQDRVGLQRCSHRLIGHGEMVHFEFDDEKGTPAQHLLCAVYAVATVPAAVRATVMGTVRKGFDWRGRSVEALLGHLAGTQQTLSLSAVADPVAWAMQLLQLTGAHPGAPAGSPSRRDVQRAFRDQLRAAHPDHGAADADAASRIADLSEARRILLG